MEGYLPLLGDQFPPGFRFHPTDQELIIHYLRKKVTASLPPASSIFAEINLYKYNPWDLPEKALFGEGEWFFFSPRERKYPNGVRPNRVAASGYWKATGTDKPILASGGAQCLGVKKALVFYTGRPPRGTKTDWVMHEYRLLDSMTLSQSKKQKESMRLDDWVLCRVRERGGLSPPENSEKSEKWNPMKIKANHDDVKRHPTLPQSSETETSNLSELSVYSKSGYLQPAISEEAESMEESSDLPGGGGGSGCFGDQERHGNGLINTKLSFAALDELMQLQSGEGFQLPPEETDSDDQGFLEFLV